MGNCIQRLLCQPVLDKAEVPSAYLPSPQDWPASGLYSKNEISQLEEGPFLPFKGLTRFPGAPSCIQDRLESALVSLLLIAEQPDFGHTEEDRWGGSQFLATSLLAVSCCRSLYLCILSFLHLLGCK